MPPRRRSCYYYCLHYASIAGDAAGYAAILPLRAAITFSSASVTPTLRDAPAQSAAKSMPDDAAAASYAMPDTLCHGDAATPPARAVDAGADTDAIFFFSPSFHIYAFRDYYTPYAAADAITTTWFITALLQHGHAIIAAAYFTLRLRRRRDITSHAQHK